MRVRKRLFSAAAGLLAPLQSASVVAGAPPIASKIALGAASLFALGIALLPAIDPLFFGVAFIPAVPIWYSVLAGAARSTNLFGLALILMTMGGVVAAMAAGFGATLLRHWPLPQWAPALPLAAAGLMVAFAWQHQTIEAADGATRVAALLRRIASAENVYAAARPTGGYTCNGSELGAIDGVDWQANPSMGTQERNQALYAGYSIRLACPASARPTSFRVIADATWAGGPRFTYDSETGAVTDTRASH